MIKIIKASKSDSKILTDIQVITFDDNSRRYFNKPYGGPPGYNSEEAVIKSIEEDKYYKIELDNEIIGGIHVSDLGDNHYELTRIYVTPSEQNKGVGQAAIKFLESTYPDVTKWSLDTPSAATSNHYLYEKLGFVKVNQILLDETSSLYLHFYEKYMTKK